MVFLVLATLSVNAGPGDVVALRGLTLNSLGGTNGIDVQSASRLDVEGAQISGFPGAGILVDDAAAPNQVSIVNLVYWELSDL